VIVLLLDSDISQTALVDIALKCGVTRVLDLHSRLIVPPLLAAITHRPPRALVGPMLRREVLDAPDQAVLLVLIAPDQLETIRSTITAARPAAALEVLNHQSSVDQIN
jgi:hypothetical protein